MRKLMQKKWFKWILVPVLFLFFAYWMSLLFNPSTEFSVLIHNFSRKNFIHYTKKRLLAGDMVDAKFLSVDNNLGIVAVRFYNFKSINNDVVLFRIKNVQSNTWYYQNYYKVDQFQPDQPFTFGFPKISNSAGKTYYFQIISTKGTKHDSIGISPIEPIFITKSQFTKKNILASWENAFVYVAKRTQNIIENKSLYYFAIIYLVPFSWYIFWQLLLIEKIRKKIGFTVFLPILILLYYSITVDQEIPGIFFILLGIWFMYTRAYKLSPSITFLMSGIFLFLSPIFEIAQRSFSAQNTAISAYYLLIIAAMQIGLYAIQKTKTFVEYNELVRKIILPKRFL